MYHKLCFFLSQSEHGDEFVLNRLFHGALLGTFGKKFLHLIRVDINEWYNDIWRPNFGSVDEQERNRLFICYPKRDDILKKIQRTVDHNAALEEFDVDKR